MRVLVILVLTSIPTAAAGADLRFQSGAAGFYVAQSDLVCVRQTYQDGRVVIAMKLGPKVAANLVDLTRRNLHQKMQLFMGDKVLVSAVIMGVITNGVIVLSGSYSTSEAQALVRDLGGPRGTCDTEIDQSR